MRTPTLKIKQITHYLLTDSNCVGDYWSREVFINGFKSFDFGDEYHSESGAKIDGMLMVLKHIFGNDNVVFEEVKIADIDEDY